MYHRTTTAGYFNFDLKALLSNSESFGKVVNILLRHLSTFHTTSDFPLEPKEKDSIPEIVVLHNLLQRGLPTMPSLHIEKALTALGFTAEKVDEYEFNFLPTEAVDAKLQLDIFTALHVVDKRFTPDYRGILESTFEEKVFQKDTNGYPYLRQLLTPQVEFETLNSGKPGFQDQRTDFALPLLYPVSDPKKEAQFIKGYVIEVDGKPYHSSFKQQILDRRRDTTLSEAGWETRRITEKGVSLHAFRDITQQDFIKNVAQHYERSFDDHWVKVLQLALVPFAIARVQKVILDAIL